MPRKWADVQEDAAHHKNAESLNDAEDGSDVTIATQRANGNGSDVTPANDRTGRFWKWDGSG